MVNFTVEDQMGMFFVSALSDLIYEGDETFNAVIVSTSSVRISPGSPDVASIVINDDTSISVFFDPSNYSTTEGGSVEISLAANTTVERTFDIKIVLLNGSAIGRHSLVLPDFIISPLTELRNILQYTYVCIIKCMVGNIRTYIHILFF